MTQLQLENERLDDTNRQLSGDVLELRESLEQARHQCVELRRKNDVDAATAQDHEHQAVGRVQLELFECEEKCRKLQHQADMHQHTVKRLEGRIQDLETVNSRLARTLEEYERSLSSAKSSEQS